MRPGPHENDTLNQVFWWEADDGSRVLTYRIPYQLCGMGRSTWNPTSGIVMTLSIGKLDHAMCFYGVGNHGGGPTRQNIDRIHALNHKSLDLPQLNYEHD